MALWAKPIFIVKDGDRFYYKDASVICFENFGKVIPEYLKLLMSSPYMEEQVKQNSAGTTVGTITIVKANEYQINEKEAAVVREIFSRFNGGESMSSISRDLNARGYRGALGGKWCAERMRNTLSNEKYLGNALLQKRYRNNHIEKKLVANKGELPMYYAEGTYEPIIDAATFKKAQERLRKIAQRTAGRKKPSRSAFSGLIRCGICGDTYKRVTYRGKHFWNCTTFQTRGKSECTAKKIPEETLMALTLEVLGIDKLSTKVVKSKITEIRAEKRNVVVFCMEDGSEIVKRWKDRPRAESWTPEMKEQARQRALQARRKKE